LKLLQYCNNFKPVREGFALVRGKACVFGGCVGVSSTAATAAASLQPGRCGARLEQHPTAPWLQAELMLTIQHTYFKTGRIHIVCMQTMFRAVLGAQLVACAHMMRNRSSRLDTLDILNGQIDQVD
jgi:hypothetical protein